MSNGQDSAFVLYVDHQGHPAPLALNYHATASRKLASSVDRHPPATITEVDSAYCPQCLSFHDATTAANLGYCPKATCRLCPVCQSVAAVAVEDATCFYKCGRCDWNSKTCFLQTFVSTSDDGNVSLEEVEKASNELASQWKERTEQRNQAAEEHYKSMLTAMQQLAKEQVKGLRSSSHQYFPTVLTNKRSLDGPDAWSVQSLEESIEARGKLVAASMDQPIGGQELQLVSLEAEQRLDPSIQGISADSILLQTSGGAAIESMDALLPLAVPLRPRKSRRCRAELSEGRPGILVKPKLNPLEGDSSLRTGHGQWWKKDSSAIEVLPRVRVSNHSSDGSKHAFLLKVSNPTLGVVRLRLAASMYTGESTWDDKTETSPFLQNLLVDSMTQLCVDAHLDTNASKMIQATDTCELEPAEDSFLELGKTSEDVPEAVSKWEAGDVLLDSKVSTDSRSSARLVGQKKSMAWFELVLLEPSQTDEYCAIPLSIQIQVGDGSWESSLIQPRQSLEGDAKDFVSFDLVIIWGKQN
mmetsp:Transcript_32604/g.54614  ORF Transcript_32604/g.54614 Transcript_32604/m.54614 type:complete len:527 (-) Transcript_32604:532-2112(-)